MPVNEKVGLAAVMDAADAYFQATGRQVTFEYVLLRGINDRPEDAVALARLMESRKAHVNLIPLNPTPGYGVAGTPTAGVTKFRDRLRALGTNATVRDNRGTDIAAACGQLAAGAPVVVRPRSPR